MLSSIQRLKNWLQTYTSLRLNDTDSVWDQALQEAMANNVKPQPAGQFTVIFGDLEVWVENWPYCYGHPYNYDYARAGNKRYPLPSRSTALKLRNYLSEHRTSDHKKPKIKTSRVMRELRDEHVQQLRFFRKKIFGEKAVFLDIA